MREVADLVWRETAVSFEPIDDGDRPYLAHRARHEAGHIVAAWALKATLGGVGILPYDRPEGGRAGGAAVYFLGSDGVAPTLGDIVALMAGPAAARRFDPRLDDGGLYDKERIDRCLWAMCRSPEAASIVHAHCAAEAKRIVTENWDAIEAVAAALLASDTLDSDQIDDVLSDVMAARANARAPEMRRAWAMAATNAADFAEMSTRTR